MERFGKFLQENPKYSAKISGYTDSVGNPEANIRLSQRRAKVVYDYFIKNYGISPERLSYKGYGATNFIATNDTEQGRRKNRRVHAIAFIK
jgi:outer membrane protein OmpA-like peptidoglycan-associated protein